MEKNSCADILNSIDADTQSDLQAILTSVSYSKGDQIFAQGDKASGIYIVTSGLVKMVRVTTDGHEMILCMLGPGGCFCPIAAYDGGSQLGFAQAAKDSVISFATSADFHNFAQSHPQFSEVVMRSCIMDMRRMVERLESLTFYKLKSRLARTLLDNCLKTRIDHTELSVVTLTQRELSQLTGVSRESISHQMAIWEKEDILTVKRGSVILRNPVLLEKFVG